MEEDRQLLVGQSEQLEHDKYMFSKQFVQYSFVLVVTNSVTNCVYVMWKK
jgi:hypothetical protein